MKMIKISYNYSRSYIKLCENVSCKIKQRQSKFKVTIYVII